jgi:hypothetical protein
MKLVKIDDVRNVGSCYIMPSNVTLIRMVGVASDTTAEPYTEILMVNTVGPQSSIITELPIDKVRERLDDGMRS